MIAFTSLSNYLPNSIIYLDENTGEAKIFKDERLDFKHTPTVVVKKELYMFKYGRPVSAYKVADFTSTENLIQTTLSTLPRNEQLQAFSVC